MPGKGKKKRGAQKQAAGQSQSPASDKETPSPDKNESNDVQTGPTAAALEPPKEEKQAESALTEESKESAAASEMQPAIAEIKPELPVFDGALALGKEHEIEKANTTEGDSSLALMTSEDPAAKSADKEEKASATSEPVVDVDVEDGKELKQSLGGAVDDQAGLPSDATQDDEMMSDNGNKDSQQITDHKDKDTPKFGSPSKSSEMNKNSSTPTSDQGKVTFKLGDSFGIGTRPVTSVYHSTRHSTVMQERGDISLALMTSEDPAAKSADKEEKASATSEPVVDVDVEDGKELKQSLGGAVDDQTGLPSDATQDDEMMSDNGNKDSQQITDHKDKDTPKFGSPAKSSEMNKNSSTPTSDQGKVTFKLGDSFGIGTRSVTSVYHSTRHSTVMQERAKYLAMTTKDKRRFYAGKRSVLSLEDIETWPVHYAANAKVLKKMHPDGGFPPFQPDDEINAKVSFFEGDITDLEIDGIVNAANSSLLGGGGVDGAIHRAAGSQLLEECRILSGCQTGDAKTTCGYKLPAKYVVHTVGPQGNYPKDLRSCYSRCLEEMFTHNMRSLAFCCISTGIYGYPNDLAVHVALNTVREWLAALKKKDQLHLVDRIIFCLFLPVDIRQYKTWLQAYFPISDSNGAGKKVPDKSKDNKIHQSDSDCPSKEGKDGIKLEPSAFDKTSHPVKEAKHEGRPRSSTSGPESASVDLEEVRSSEEDTEAQNKQEELKPEEGNINNSNPRGSWYCVVCKTYNIPGCVRCTICCVLRNEFPNTQFPPPDAVTLLRGNPGLLIVQDIFSGVNTATLDGITVPIVIGDLGNKELKIVRVDRNVNVPLLQEYSTKKKIMLTKRSSANELYLVHGTSLKTAKEIMLRGFNRSYSFSEESKGSTYGKGNYYATVIGHALDFTAPNENGLRVLLLVRVLTGVVGVGKEGDVVPPALGRSDRCDCSVDSLLNPTVFVSYADGQSFPALAVYVTWEDKKKKKKN